MRVLWRFGVKTAAKLRDEIEKLEREELGLREQRRSFILRLLYRREAEGLARLLLLSS